MLKRRLVTSFTKIGTSRVLASFLMFFVNFLFSREEEYLKRRRVVKQLRNLTKFYPIFTLFYHNSDILMLMCFWKPRIDGRELVVSYLFLKFFVYLK